MWLVCRETIIEMYSSAHPKDKTEVDECGIPMLGCHDQLPRSDGYGCAGEFITAHFQQPEETSSHPRCSIGANRYASGLHCVPVSRKMPKFSGKGSWEVYQAQFELLAAAAHWPDSVKALQPALALMEDASACLLLFSLEERGDDMAPVGTLQRRFGKSNLKNSLRCKSKHRVR